MLTFNNFKRHKKKRKGEKRQTVVSGASSAERIFLTPLLSTVRQEARFTTLVPFTNPQRHTQ